MNFQVGDLLQYFNSVEAKRYICLVKEIEDNEGLSTVITVEWFSSYAAEFFSSRLSPGVFHSDTSGYWSKLS